MSCKENDVWVEGAYENLREAIENKEWGLAKCVIADTMDKGFMDEARNMNAELRKASNEQPTFADKYILAFLKKKNEQFKKMGLIPTVDVLIEEIEGKGASEDPIKTGSIVGEKDTNIFCEMEGTKVEKETPRCKKCGERTIRWYKQQVLTSYHCSYCGTDMELKEMEGKKE